MKITIRLVAFVILLFAFSAHAQPNPLLSALPNNTAVDLGKYTCTGAVGESSNICRQITDYSTFAYHSGLHKLLMFGGGHASTFRDDVDVFDFTSLTWGHGDVSTPCSAMTQAGQASNGTWTLTGHPHARHTYDLLVVSRLTNELMLLVPPGTAPSGASCQPQPPGYDQWRAYPGNIMHYSPVVQTWDTSPATPQGWGYHAAEEDPISGKIVIVGQSGLFTYDPVTRVRSPKLTSVPAAVAYANNLIYYPPNQKMYYIARGTPTGVFEVTLNRTNWNASTVVQVTGIVGTLNSQESGWDYDPITESIGGGILNGVFYAYHPPTKTWTGQTMQRQSSTSPPPAIGTVASHALRYNPVDGVFMFLTGYPNFRMWAYKYRTPINLTAPVPPVHFNVSIQ